MKLEFSSQRASSGLELESGLKRRDAPGGGRTLAAVERDYILGVLGSVGGNKARAAVGLDIGTATLFRKLKQYGRGAAAARGVAPAVVVERRGRRRIRRQR